MTVKKINFDPFFVELCEVLILVKYLNFVVKYSSFFFKVAES